MKLATVDLNVMAAETLGSQLALIPRSIFETTSSLNDSPYSDAERSQSWISSASIPDNSTNMLLYALIQYGTLVIFWALATLSTDP